MNTIRAGILAVVLTFVSGCSLLTGPDDLTMIGTVTSVDSDNPRTIRLQLSEDSPLHPGGRATVHVENAAVAVPGPFGTRPGSIADLPPGTRVVVRTTPGELRSLPPQYDAIWVRVEQ